MLSLRAIYSLFLIFITPLALPLTVFACIYSDVTAWVWVLFILYYLATGVGISIGFHRLLAHKSFKTHAYFKRFLLMLGCTGMQGPPAAWACLHRQHHLHADTDEDPHSPKKGFWHAHCLWIFENYKPKWLRYGRDLLKDPDAMWVTKYYDLFALSGLVIPFALASWQGLLIAGCLRLFLSSQHTFFLNSISHIIGYQPIKQRNHSGNHWVTNILSFGEGWHNNHHAYPRAAFHGQRWYELDVMGIVLQACQKVGLIWDVQTLANK